MNTIRLTRRGVPDVKKMPHCPHAIRTAAMRRLTSPASPWPAGRCGPSALIPLRAVPCSALLRRRCLVAE
eukprot:9406951-Pyramimonas_sp.AAC.1